MSEPAAAAAFSAHAPDYTGAGFAPVDCVCQSWRFAVMAAFKEDGE